MIYFCQVSRNDDVMIVEMEVQRTTNLVVEMIVMNRIDTEKVNTCEYLNKHIDINIELRN